MNTPTRATKKKMTETKDKKIDKKFGVKEDSAKDMKKDAKLGMPFPFAKKKKK